MKAQIFIALLLVIGIVAAAPTITSLSRDAGSSAGGALLTIYGSSFVSGASVTFGSNAASSVTVVNATQITLTTPSHAVGIVDVVVTQAGGSATLTNGFEYLPAPTIVYATQPDDGTFGTLHPTPGQFGPTVVTAAAEGITPYSNKTYVVKQTAAANDANNHAIGFLFQTTNAPPANLDNPSAADPNGIYYRWYLYITQADKNAFDAALQAGTGQMKLQLARPYNQIGKPWFMIGMGPEFSTGRSLGVLANSDFDTGATYQVDTGQTLQVGWNEFQVSYRRDTSAHLGYAKLWINGKLGASTAQANFGFDGLTTDLEGASFGMVYVQDVASPLTTYVAGIQLANGFIDPSNTSAPASQPAITSLSRDAGTVNGGTNLIINGANLTGQTTVTFGGVAATNATLVNPTQLNVTTPAHGLGVVDIIVSNAGQSATLANGFQYLPAPTTIYASQPTDGTLGSWKNGGGFQNASQTYTRAGHPYSLECHDNLASYASPPGYNPVYGAIEYDFQNNPAVYEPNGVYVSWYVYIPATTITNVNGPGGQIKLMLMREISGSTNHGWLMPGVGSGFQGYQTPPDNKLVVFIDNGIHEIPPGGQSSPSYTTTNLQDSWHEIQTWQSYYGGIGYISMWVDGKALFTNVTSSALGISTLNDPYYVALGVAYAQINGPTAVYVDSATIANGYIEPGSINSSTPASQPAITSLSRDAGTVNGGTNLIINGANFTGQTTVTFGGASTTNITLLSSTQLQVTTPPHAVGPVNVIVTNAGLSATLTSGFEYLPAPTTTYVTSDFESGVLSPFFTWLGNTNTNVVASVAHSGTHSVQSTFFDGVNSALEYDFGNNNYPVSSANGEYAHWFFYVPAATKASLDAGSAEQIKMLLQRYTTPPNTGWGELAIGKGVASANGKVRMVGDQDPGNPQIGSEASYAADTWYEVEVWFSRDPVAHLGTMKWWFGANGNLKYMGTRTDAFLGTDGATDNPGISFGVYSQLASTYPISVYTDDAAIANGFIESASNMSGATSPIITITSPSANQVLAAGTTSTSLLATINVISTCKYSAVDQSYSLMPSTMTGAGSTSQSATINGLSNGQVYTYYIRCNDTSGNTNTVSSPVSFSVAQAQSNSSTGANATRLFYTTLDNLAALAVPVNGVGAGLFINTTPANDFAQARNAQGLRIDANGEYAKVQETDGIIPNINLSQGTAEFWYQPTYSPNDGLRHFLLNVGSIATAPGGISIQKSNAANNNEMNVQATDSSGTLTGASISPASYNWNPGDWVRIRFTWDFTVPAGVQNIHIYVNGVEGTYTGTPATGPHTMSSPSQTQYLYIGNRDAAALTPANGIIDDLAIYDQPISGLLPNTYRPGDLNDDGRVDFNDMLIIIGQFGKSGAAITNTRADLNSDGVINLFDFILTAKHWGTQY